MLPPPPSAEAVAVIRSALGAAPVNHFYPGAVTGQDLFETIDPATGELLGQVAAGGAADVDCAVAAAKTALPGWAATLPQQRAAILNRLANLIEADGEAIAITESLDNGMPWMLARFASVGGAVEQLRYNAGWATKIAGETLQPSWPGEWQAMTVREPVGVVAAIVPFNFPFVMAVAKLAPALAAGCTVVLKPAEQTSLSAARLPRLLVEAGVPEGVVTIVFGQGASAGAALVAHRDVAKVSFTGSTATGQGVIASSIPDLKRVSLELGGKSPTFIFPDADPARACPAAAMGIFGNSGQVCAAGSRLYVHDAVYDQVVDALVERARTIRLGAGLEPRTEMGPLVSKVQQHRVLGYIASGVEQGARLLVGGEAPDRPGWFVEPTILADVTDDMRVMQEEIFGPVLCVSRFADCDVDALADMANATAYGLSAAIWTRDVGQGLRLARRIRAGTVRINGGGGVDPALPMGGYGLSGWGRENGSSGIEAFTEIKTITIGLS